MTGLRVGVPAPLVAALIAVGLTACLEASPEERSPSVTDPADVAGHLRVAIAADARLARSRRVARRQDIVILLPWRTRALRRLKAIAPATRVLMYMDVAALSSKAGPRGIYATGVSRAEALGGHPEWLLRDPDGAPFNLGGQYWLWAADVGSASYQRRFLRNLRGQLRRHPWDGVLLDDVNATLKYHQPLDRVAKYPTDAAYQAAMGAFVERVAGALREDGELVIANMTWAEYPTVCRGWMRWLSGGMEEFLGKYPGGPGAGYVEPWRWRTAIENLEWAQARRKIFLGVTRSTTDDVAAARLGWASLLLGAGGRAYFALQDDYKRQPGWIPEYDYAIGEPLGAAEEAANGVFSRRFSRGLVVVNPTPAAQAVDFGGEFEGSGLGPSAGTTIAPNSGLVLVSSRR
jgi:Hypothetical glycosyl hydrolase family 15